VQTTLEPVPTPTMVPAPTVAVPTPTMTSQPKIQESTDRTTDGVASYPKIQESLDSTTLSSTPTPEDLGVDSRVGIVGEVAPPPSSPITMNKDITSSIEEDTPFQKTNPGVSGICSVCGDILAVGNGATVTCPTCTTVNHIVTFVDAQAECRCKKTIYRRRGEKTMSCPDCNSKNCKSSNVTLAKHPLYSLQVFRLFHVFLVG